jgi:uncharacterized Zn-finger protein
MWERKQALNAGDYGDFSWNDQPKCPHCGSDYSITENDGWRLYDESETHDVECPVCDQSFRVNSHADWRFSTDEQDDD